MFYFFYLVVSLVVFDIRVIIYSLFDRVGDLIIVDFGFS